MKVLWLSQYPPWPYNNGGRIRLSHLLRPFLARDDAVDLWIVGAGGDVSLDRGGLADHHNLTVRLFPKGGRNTLDRAVELLSARPAAATRLLDQDVLVALSVIEPRSYDVAIIEQSFLGVYSDLLEKLGVPTVLDAQNIESALLAQLAPLQPSWPRRASYKLESVKGRRFERRLFRRVSLVAAASEVDADKIRLLSGQASVSVHPNGVDTTYHHWHDHSSPSGLNLLMTGTLSYAPNADAAAWFDDEIMPMVRADLPSAVLRIVGRSPSEQLRRRSDVRRGVIVVGEVDDVRPYMQSADVFIAPLRAGGGTRLKVLEALAAGLPVVATSIAIEGLGVAEAGLVRIGNSTQEIVAQVKSVIADEGYRRTVGREGRRFVEQKYDWGGIGSNFRTVAAEHAIDHH